MEKIVLVGCGGHAKSIVDAIESQGVYEIAGFVGTIDDKTFLYNKYKVIGSDSDFDSIHRSGVKNAFVCVGFMGEGKIRNILFEQLKKTGYVLPSVIDKTAAIAQDAKIEEGVFVGKNAVINSNAVVDRMSIINTAAVVEHDCRVGEFSHISVGAVLCGNVSIGANSMIGANATVIQGNTIGDNVIVGAGSIVLTDLDDNQKAVGIIKSSTR